MTDTTNQNETAGTAAPDGARDNIARNEPCPCGSRKKYKRCHGVDAKGIVAQKSTEAPADNSIETAMSGFDPSSMDMNWMAQFSTMMNRLPKGQFQRLQILMRQAMAGKDVEQEMAEFQRTLPKQFQEMLLQGPKAVDGGEVKTPDLSEVDGKPSRGFFKRLFKR